jgi:hypothetical protein
VEGLVHHILYNSLVLPPHPTSPPLLPWTALASQNWGPEMVKQDPDKPTNPFLSDSLLVDGSPHDSPWRALCG